MKSIADIDEWYVINLPERIDRLREIDSEMERYGVKYTLFEAVKNQDGKLGLLDSMKKLLSTAISKNQSNIAVLEDDVTFLAPPIDFLNTVIPQVPEDYNLFYMGANLCQTPWRISENVLQIKMAYATHAIVYSRAGMERALSLLNEHVTAYDIILMNNMHGDKCYCAYPLLCTQREGWSDIEKKVMNWGELMRTTFNMHTKMMLQQDGNYRPAN